MKDLSLTSKILIGLGFLSFIVVVALIVFGGEPKPDVKKYKTTDPARPQISLSQDKIDWGEIDVKDTKISEIELRNNGESPLVITNLSTSCGCASVKVSYNGEDTKEYNMHQPLSNNITIEPKTSAKVTITYKPFTMPVDGPVTRQVFIESNDPISPKLEIVAKAVVRK